ncbi:hypothetical protein [Desulfocastanea catecholica]
MKKNAALSLVQQIMAEFAEQTGLSPVSTQPQRYLWTDAFAVCNFLELYRLTGEDKYRSLALSLVDQVHATLGRYAVNDPRRGWISGLSAEQGRLHPTAGGLRIGKKMNERGLDEPYDEKMEWDRDGQYYHYLLKWIHALQCVGKATSTEMYYRWAGELAKKIHAGFVFASAMNGRKYIHWKMSIDLTRPLVPSMGLHDPLEGFIIYSQLQAGRSPAPEKASRLNFTTEINELADICRGLSWATEDPLGIGGLLCNALQVAQMMVRGSFAESNLLPALLDSAHLGLETYLQMNPLRLPASYRLAFREFGLSIGLHAIARLKALILEETDAFTESAALLTRLDKLMHYQSVGEHIEQFWDEKVNREADTWLEHRAINMVMQATSLVPDGFLQVP